MTCARCPNPTPITVQQAGVELCRVCADLGAEKTNAPDYSEASDRHPPLGLVEAALRAPRGASRSHIDHDRPTRERQAQSPARPARSKR